MTKAEALKKTSKEINSRVNELSKTLDTVMGDEWDIAYEEYCTLNSILSARYCEENLERFEAYFFKHIYGKTWEELDYDAWDFYSDWHKDMFGYRPKSTDKDW